MRYKEQAQLKLTQIENTILKLQFQVSRQEPQDTILETIQELKEKVEEISGFISIEHNDFESYI